MRLEIEEVCYSYRGGFRLGPVSLSAETGSFVALLGPNGSGKTTLFSLINGSVKPDSGKITVGGKLPSACDPKERARMMGMVPQLSSREFDYTVEQMLLMGRYPHQGLFDSESKEDLEMADSVMTRLDLGKLRGRSVRRLSGGEFQRVLLGRTLVQDPAVLLLDEPGNHLDLKHQSMLLTILGNEARAGKTVVAVLHDINQAMCYADSCILLNEGKVVCSGAPAEILTQGVIRRVFGVDMQEYKSPDGRVIYGFRD